MTLQTRLTTSEFGSSLKMMNSVSFNSTLSFHHIFIYRSDDEMLEIAVVIVAVHRHFACADDILEAEHVDGRTSPCEKMPRINYEDSTSGR
jgi:hypothetical protein